MKELKVTDEAVRKAADQCPDAERVLKTLFPDVFEVDRSVLLTRSSAGIIRDTISGESVADVRSAFEYKDKAIFLNKNYFNYEMKEDSNGTLCLIPTRKY